MLREFVRLNEDNLDSNDYATVCNTDQCTKVTDRTGTQVDRITRLTRNQNFHFVLKGFLFENIKTVGCFSILKFSLEDVPLALLEKWSIVKVTYWNMGRILTCFSFFRSSGCRDPKWNVFEFLRSIWQLKKQQMKKNGAFPFLLYNIQLLRPFENFVWKDVRGYSEIYTCVINFGSYSFTTFWTWSVGNNKKTKCWWITEWNVDQEPMWCLWVLF